MVRHEFTVVLLFLVVETATLAVDDKVVVKKDDLPFTEHKFNWDLKGLEEGTGWKILRRTNVLFTPGFTGSEPPKDSVGRIVWLIELTTEEGASIFDKADKARKSTTAPEEHRFNFCLYDSDGVVIREIQPSIQGRCAKGERVRLTLEVSGLEFRAQQKEIKALKFYHGK